MTFIVVDNGSTDETTDIERFFPGLRVVRLPEPIGYLGACNAGAEVGTGGVYLFTNNDIEVDSDVISAALKRFGSDSRIGAVGGRIIQMDGLLQEAGSFVHQDGSGVGFGRDCLPFDQDVTRPREVEYLLRVVCCL